MITCEMCQHPNREERRYCAACGRRLGWWCAECGFFNFQNETHCGGCSNLENKQANLPQDETRSSTHIHPPTNQPAEMSLKPAEKTIKPQATNLLDHRDDLIDSAIHDEMERIAREGTETTSTGNVSQDDIDKLFE